MVHSDALILKGPAGIGHDHNFIEEGMEAKAGYITFPMSMQPASG